MITGTVRTGSHRGRASAVHLSVLACSGELYAYFSNGRLLWRPRSVSTVDMHKKPLSSFAATPADLRQIVLSYLCDNCYADTAQVFARDSATRELDKDGDEVLASGVGGALDAQVVRKVQSRKEIKMQLLSGRINEAIDTLKLHFPAVLAPSGRTHDAPRYDPAHLFLNLRIQNFIEQSRTMPLPWPSDILLPSNPPTQKSSPAPKFSLLPDIDTDASTHAAERIDRLLALMHELRELTSALVSPRDRDTYQMELSTVGGLLAYPIPEKSREMRKYLDMGRREAVAEQINEALLYRSNVPIPGVVELSARQTTLLFATLSSLGRKLPSPENRPVGFEALLSGNLSRPGDLKAHKVTKEKETPDTFPVFDMKRFLDIDST